jgi:hypothetical protein
MASMDNKMKMDSKMKMKYFNLPDEVRTFEKGKVELVKFGDKVVGKMTLQPGWRWSQHVKPIVKTEWCEAPHFQYLISGTMGVKMADGTESVVKAGSVSMLPPGHDGWVIGNEDVVAIDFQGMIDYAKK